METLNLNTFIGQQVLNACKTLKIHTFDIAKDSNNFRYSLDNKDFDVYFINDDEFTIQLMYDHNPAINEAVLDQQRLDDDASYN